MRGLGSCQVVTEPRDLESSRTVGGYRKPGGKVGGSDKWVR